MEKVLKSPTQKAATISWTAPLIAFILSFFSKNIPNPSQTTNVIVLGICLLFYVIGLVSGIIALRRRAPREPNVTAPAVVGIFLSTSCLLIIGSVVFANM